MYSPVHVRYLGAITKDHIRQGSISAPPPIHTFKKEIILYRNFVSI